MNADAEKWIEQMQNGDCRHMSEYHCLYEAVKWAYADAANCVRASKLGIDSVARRDAIESKAKWIEGRAK